MARITLGAERFNTEASREEYRGLESGDILFFPSSSPLVPEADRAFLVTQKQASAAFHKNVSYRPLEDRLKGVDQNDALERARVHEIMRAFSQRAIEFMAKFLGRYAADWKVDYASFRPIEESGRQAAASFTQRPFAISTRLSRPGLRMGTGCCGSSSTFTPSASASG